MLRRSLQMNHSSAWNLVQSVGNLKVCAKWVPSLDEDFLIISPKQGDNVKKLVGGGQ